LDSFNDDAYGGTGQTFNLSLIEGKISLPFLVAGGIDESNFKQAVVLDNCIGIDVCSSIEDKPGIKNHIKLKNLVKNVRSFNV
jgi:phosphoribosylanthranilate isomerase